MSTKHDIHLGEMRIGMAVCEMLEDGIAEVLEHYQNPASTVKSSTVTIKVTLMPDEQRRKYNINVAQATALSPRSTFSTDVYGGIDGADGLAKIVEWDPHQLRMFEGDKTPI